MVVVTVDSFLKVEVAGDDDFNLEVLLGLLIRDPVVLTLEGVTFNVDVVLLSLEVATFTVDGNAFLEGVTFTVDDVDAFLQGDS